MPFVAKKLLAENAVEQAMHRLEQWNFSPYQQKLAHDLLNEWYSDRALGAVLNQWESNTSQIVNNIKTPSKLMCYNVLGWGTRALEVIELVFRLEISICVLTEVGELWRTNKIPHFNTFFQKGTNHSGGVCIGVGKHLKATRIETDIPNTLVIDIAGLSEPVRVIGIYWPKKDRRNLDDLTPFITENTILTGDFNAANKNWNSPLTDTRGEALKTWIEENNLSYTPSTAHSSKRSLRNIDFVFSNMTNISCETTHEGSSDHWPLVVTCQNATFDKSGTFAHTNWKVFEVILTLLQNFWREEQERTSTNAWYCQYVRFLVALKNRVTQWKEKARYKPALPEHVVEQLREVRKLRNKFYHLRQKGILCEETRLLLRVRTRETGRNIGKYKATQWQKFLATIQQAHDMRDKRFWLYMSSIYKARSLPFYKLMSASKVVVEEKEIAQELLKYYSEQFKQIPPRQRDAHEEKIDAECKHILEILAESKEEMKQTNVREVTWFIRSLKPKTSTGFDQISNAIIKKLPPSYIEYLVCCFNQWLRDSTYLEEWKIARIITLNKLKSGTPKCEQTRPISLLATHSKLFEKIILSRLRDWAESNNLVPAEQSGFRPRCLLPTRVLSIYQEIRNNLAANVPTLAIYIDYQKAYDRVWHSALITKLWRFDIPHGLLKMIIAWLKSRRAYVSFGKTVSTTFDINIGLPQGSSLSPYLFVVFHCDLVHRLGAHSGHVFADDLCVIIKPPLETKLEPMI